MMPFPGLKKPPREGFSINPWEQLASEVTAKAQIIRNQRLCLCPAACDRDVTVCTGMYAVSAFQRHIHLFLINKNQLIE
jgi:hypothetical protein